MKYPTVLSEWDTVSEILAGRSLSRFGDGELAIAMGGGNSTHAANSRLAGEMRAVLENRDPQMVVAIPNLDPRLVRLPAWQERARRYGRLLDSGKVYGSSFLGRPKCAPWTADEEHLRRYRSAWDGRNVVAICPESHPLPNLTKARHVVECPKTEAYDEIERLESEAHATGADLAVICAGPCATVLAARLCRNGLQALDIGRGAGAILKTIGPAA